MLPEWGRFVTAVKLNKGLKDSNFDQLYAYLKQHEGRQNRGQGNNARGAGQLVMKCTEQSGDANPGQARQVLEEELCVVPRWWAGQCIDDDVDVNLVQDFSSQRG
ncbi:hypothetical protein Tco_0355292 [Tanacetum coccineum]